MLLIADSIFMLTRCLQIAAICSQYAVDRGQIDNMSCRQVAITNHLFASSKLSLTCCYQFAIIRIRTQWTRQT